MLDVCHFNKDLFKDCPCKILVGNKFLCNFEDLYWEYKGHKELSKLPKDVCGSARIEVYCKENNLNLCTGSIPCSCKVIYEETFFCNFGNIYAELIFHHKNLQANILLNSVCQSVRNESMNRDFLARETRRIEEEFLKKVTVGDAVYCTTEGEYVTLLEKPNKIGRKCKYKTLKGLINEQWAFCFRTISKGNATSEYEVKGKRYEERALYLKHLACSNRFRVETQELRDSILLKIFGDLQEEVDNFINLSCINDLTLF